MTDNCVEPTDTISGTQQLNTKIPEVPYGYRLCVNSLSEDTPMNALTKAWLFIAILGLAIGIYLAETYNYIEMVEPLRYGWEPW
ncbi:hypothetical protein [Nitrospira sp. Ecomares 2.1]